MIAVLDTNIVISALLAPNSPPGKAVEFFLSGTFDVALSSHLQSELTNALEYPRVRDRLTGRFAPGAIADWLNAYWHAAVRAPDREPTAAWVVEDPDDDWVIQCAMDAGASYVVTGDKALLRLGNVEGIKIVSAREFCGIVESGGG